MKNLKAVKYAYSIFACALIAFGLAVLLKGWFPAEPFMLFGGILMIGFGAIRILGYCSKDALQLAFQFDLFLGIASAVLGCYMIWDTQAAGHIVMVLGVFFLIDALSKIQTASDARRIGVERWWLILGVALVANVALFIVFFFDLDGKLLFNVVEPFLKKHYDDMERKDTLQMPYDMDKYPKYDY